MPADPCGPQLQARSYNFVNETLLVPSRVTYVSIRDMHSNRCYIEYIAFQQSLPNKDIYRKHHKSLTHYPLWNSCKVHNRDNCNIQGYIYRNVVHRIPLYINIDRFVFRILLLMFLVDHNHSLLMKKISMVRTWKTMH